MENPGFIKYIDQDFYESTGEKKVREIPTIVEFVKTAAFNDLHQDVRNFISNLKPRDGYGYLLISAMSDENWGDNNNGDYFPEESLNNPTPDFGHRTFQRLAHWYRLHKNKDVKGAYGKVIFSYWNPRMHRVELIVEYDKVKDDWTSQAIADNQDIEVSMGCFPAGSRTMLADYTEVPIETLDVGERVLNANGEATTIKKLDPRPYSGDIYNIQSLAMDKIECTEEHPLFAVLNENLKKRQDPNYEDLRWVKASDLSIGDYLATPIIQETYTPDYANESLAKLLGWYLAEGHIVRNKAKKIAGVEFSVGSSDAIVSEIEDVCRNLETKNVPKFRKCPRTDKAMYIGIYDSKSDSLAEKCYMLCGSYAKRKKLDESLLYWDMELQKIFLGAYIDGDGCCQKGKWQPGAVTISTASCHLKTQIVAILHRLGIIPSVSTIYHRTSYSRGETREYQVYIGKTFVHILKDYSTKIAENYIPPKLKIMRRPTDGKYVYSRIVSIDREYRSEIVYNFEVEDGESYVVNGLSVHNCKVNYDVCSICHPNWRQFYKIPENKMIELSKTKSLDEIYEIGKAYGIDLSYVKELNPEGGAKGISRNATSYCDHIKHYKRKVLLNGQKVFMVNLRPVFFDISFVRIHADKSSYVLAKVASEIPTQPIECIGPDCVTLDEIEEYIKKHGDTGKLSEDKEAEIEKRIKGEILATGGDKIRHYMRENILPVLSENEKTIPNEVLDNMASKNSLEEILSSFLGLGMFPRPREFQRIVLIIQGKKQEADEFDRDGIHITNEDSDKYYQALKSMGDTRMAIGPDFINDGLLEQLLPFAGAKSYFHRPICTRIIMIKKAFIKQPFGEIPPQRPAKPVINTQMPSQETKSPLPAILAAVAAYLGLAKASGKNIKPILQTMAKHKGKILASVVGAAVVSELAQQADQEVQANKAFLAKHGGIAGKIGKGLFLFPGIPAATYVAGEHFKQKAYRGRRLSIPEKTIAKHPFATSIGAVMVAHKGSRKMIGSILKKLFKTGELMVKAGMDFEGLDLADYPVHDHEKIIVGLWDALAKHGASLIDPNFKED